MVTLRSQDGVSKGKGIETEVPMEERMSRMEEMMAELQRSTLDFQKSTLEAQNSTARQISELMATMNRSSDRWLSNSIGCESEADETDNDEDRVPSDSDLVVNDIEKVKKYLVAIDVDSETDLLTESNQQFQEQAKNRFTTSVMQPSLEVEAMETKSSAQEIGSSATNNVQLIEWIHEEESEKERKWEDVKQSGSLQSYYDDQVKSTELVVRDQTQEIRSDVVYSPWVSVKRDGAVETPTYISRRANRVWKPGGLLCVQDHSGGSTLMITQQFHGLQLQRIIYMDMKFQEVLIDDVLSVMVCLRMDETSSDLLLLNGKENEGCLNGSQALVLMKGITESSSRIEELMKEEPDFVKVNEVKKEKQSKLLLLSLCPSFICRAMLRVTVKQRKHSKTWSFKYKQQRNFRLLRCVGERTRKDIVTVTSCRSCGLGKKFLLLNLEVKVSLRGKI